MMTLLLFPIINLMLFEYSTQMMNKSLIHILLRRRSTLVSYYESLFSNRSCNLIISESSFANCLPLSQQFLIGYNSIFLLKFLSANEAQLRSLANQSDAGSRRFCVLRPRSIVGYHPHCRFDFPPSGLESQMIHDVFEPDFIDPTHVTERESTSSLR